MELVITQNTTLDGVIDMSAGWADPDPTPDPAGDSAEMIDTLRASMAQESAQLYGRATFEAMRGFWPAQTDDTTGITAHLDAIPKHVVSRTMTDPAWDNSTLVRGDLLEAVRALKAQPGGNLGVTGSISVTHELLRAGLVDELRLYVYPVVIGAGRRLFPEGLPRLDLALVGSRSFASGITLQTYRPV